MRTIRLRCQQIMLNNLQCPRRVFRDGKICRWHRISNEFRADFKQRGKLFSSLLMVGAGTAAYEVFVCLMNYSRGPDLGWLIFAAAAFGWLLMLFADSVMARDYPLSQLACWPQMLAIGMVLAILGSAIVSAYALKRPEVSLAVIRTIYAREFDHRYGPAIAASIGIGSAAMLIPMLVTRILYFDTPKLGIIMWPIVVLMIGSVFRPVLQSAGIAPSPQQVQGFWAPVLGNNVAWPLSIAWFIAFNICEVINVGIRRTQCDAEIFKMTLWPSLPICMLSPMVAMLASRFVLSLFSVSGAYVFGALAAILSVPPCILSTGWVIRHAVSARDREHLLRARETSWADEDPNYQGG